MQTVDVSAVIDRAPVSAFQKLTMAICGLVVFLDGFDAQVIGPVAPAIAKAWGDVPPRVCSFCPLGCRAPVADGCPHEV